MTTSHEIIAGRIVEADREATAAMERWVLLRAALGKPLTPEALAQLTRLGLLIPQIAERARTR